MGIVARRMPDTLPVGASALLLEAAAGEDELGVVELDEAGSVAHAHDREARQGVEESEHPLLVCEILCRRRGQKAFRRDAQRGRNGGREGGNQGGTGTE